MHQIVNDHMKGCDTQERLTNFQSDAKMAFINNEREKLRARGRLHHAFPVCFLFGRQVLNK